MDEKTAYIELAKKARLGDKASLDELAQMVRGRLYAYVFRIVLQDDLAQDIVQESMLEMVKVFGKLEKADKFWPWLCGIAANKIRRSYKNKQRRKTVSLSKLGDGNWISGDPKAAQEGLANLVGQELRQIILAAMGHLKPRYRMVLTMRCYEQMEYPEIAKSMRCSEFNVRLLFFRAKKSLAKQLARNGFGKGSLLTALVLFGKMTAPSEAAAAQISVTAAATKVGIAASTVGVVASKTTVVSLTAAGALAVGTTMIAGPEAIRTVISPEEPAVKSAQQLVVQDYWAQSRTLERWYYYPSGSQGPVMMRVVKWDADGIISHCQRLQNGRANYRFDQSDNTIYIENGRMLRNDLSVERLPTDGAQLSESLSAVQGKTVGMEYVDDDGEGLLVTLKPKSNELGVDLQVAYQLNLLDEEYFQYDWPRSAQVVDNRDTMHKRGWTYFRIAGQVRGEKIAGTGRIPFVYDSSRENPAWLKLQIGDRLTIEDSDVDARIYGSSGMKFDRYKSWSFFKGLARPWMGLHTIDTIRRDAAQKQIQFETNQSGNGQAKVALSDGKYRIIYSIDLEKDIITRITFLASDGQGYHAEGELIFSYLEDIDQTGDEFAEPRKKDYGKSQREGLGILWLIRLAEGNL